MRSIFIDITEFMLNPARTGIQMVVRQIIRRLPLLTDVSFVAYDRDLDGFYHLSKRSLDFAVVASDLDRISNAEIATCILDANQANRSSRISLQSGSILFIPEVFYDPARMRFYERLQKDCNLTISMLVYDFAAYTSPQSFRIEQGGASFFLPYVDLIKSATSRSFISDHVRSVYHDRIVRRAGMHQTDITNPLGADGLMCSKQHYDQTRKRFICIGSFDGKKNQDIVFEAFLKSGLADHGHTLCFYGKVPTDLPAHMRFARDIHVSVDVIDMPTDRQILGAYANAIACVFVGTVEGYGLPAVEGLHIGMPCIVYEKMPCLKDIPSGGQVRLSEVSLHNLLDAFKLFENQKFVQDLWNDAAAITLPTWDSWTRRTARWLDSWRTDAR